MTSSAAEPVVASRSAQGSAALVGGVVAWSAMGVMVKLASLDAFDVAFWRLWMGFVVMYAIGALVRRRLTLRAVRVSLVAGTCFAADVLLFFAALKLTSVANATLITSMQPVLIMGVAARLFGERVSAWRLGWAVAAIGGVVLVIAGGRGAAAGDLAGDGIAAAALVAWAAYFLATKHARMRVGAYEYVTSVMLVSAVIATPFALATGPALPAPRDWLWLSILVASGAVGHLLVSWGQRWIDVSLASLIALGVPVTSAFWGWVVLDERLRAVQFAGAAVALGAIAALVTRGESASVRR